MSSRARRQSALAALSVVALLAPGCAGPVRPARVALGADAHGRPTLPVRVDGKGPFPFVLDTGAERSMIQGALADRLGLSPVPLVNVKVEATGGATHSRMLLARSLAGGLFTRSMEPLFELPSAGVTSAGGILGMNVFAHARLAIDLRGGTASVGPSGPAPAGVVALPARVVRGDLVVVPVTVDGVEALAMIDTGARRTLGNPALLRALGLSPGGPGLAPAEPTTGASRDSVPAWSAALGGIAAGGLRFARPTVTFSDAPVFARTFPDAGPALILGVDLLRTLDELAIDYPRAEVQLRRAGAP